MASRHRGNALVDDPDWCGHFLVSLRTWTCADCGRATTEATRERLRNAPTVAPPGSFWVLLSGPQDICEHGFIRGSVGGLFTDRSKIAQLLIRRMVYDADSIRDKMRRTHWYQGAYNVMVFEGWEEEPDASGETEAYRLDLEQVDHP